MCVTAHALLSALAARIEGGGRDATADELRAIIASGCPRADVERTLAEKAKSSAHDGARAAFARALAMLDA